MRRDFAKLLFERPKSNRTWVSKTPRPTTVRFAADGDVANEAAQHYRRKQQKFAGERSNALRRFLIGETGRPWDKVFSEICAVLDDRSYAGSRTRDFLASLVHLDCYLDGRVIRCAETRQPVRGLFVDPRTGLLRRAPDLPRS
jgi:hypothetical protein